MAAHGSLRAYFLLEARHAPWRAPVAMAVWGVAAVFGTHAVLERFPEQALRFLERAFEIRGMAAVLVVNDLVATYFATFFVGLMGLLGTVVAAREEKRLELVLAKPVPARTLLAARVWPVLATSAVVGVLIALTTAAAIGPYLAPGDMVTVAGALGAGLFLVALALVLLAALLPLLVRMRDGFHALLCGSIVWIASAMPAAVLIYRPDLFEGHELVKNTIAMPTLVWHDAISAWLGPVALALAPVVCAGLLTFAGRVLEQTDV